MKFQKMKISATV